MLTGAAQTDLVGKREQIFLLAFTQLLAMSVWFSASAVLPQLRSEWLLSDSSGAWLTISVQLGFVAGALASALLNISDRVSGRILIAASAFLAAAANTGIAFFAEGIGSAFLWRFVTGFFLAGVYPPGMKLVASWCREDRGLGVGILVGALTVGSALPHLLNGGVLGYEGLPPWRTVVLGTSGLALVAGFISLIRLRPGPHLAHSAPFDIRAAWRVLAHKPTRLANYGYLGHMWELYAMWAWVPIFLLESYQAAGLSVSAARLAAFVVVGSGALGSVVAGLIADRVGRAETAAVCLLVSGACCVLAGLCFERPVLATVVCIVWGVFVVADSAQFSASVSELSDPRYVGTSLTLQTSLGFLLTAVTIRLVPYARVQLGWRYVFVVLAAGAAFGALSMWRLRRTLAREVAS